jgi:hypothetical protein
VLRSHLSVPPCPPRTGATGSPAGLVHAVFVATGTQRMDVVTDSADAFLRTLPHRAMSGYRVASTTPAERCRAPAPVDRIVLSPDARR